jgi:flagellar motor protein MotB
MVENLEKTGKARLYGVDFDALRPESGADAARAQNRRVELVKR